MTSRRTRGLRRLKGHSAYEGDPLPNIEPQHPKPAVFVPNEVVLAQQNAQNLAPDGYKKRK